ncbi:MAG: hypothetical protein SP1CHLAM54_08420 [Chlamydiia bacterium]|nr:hypothetical protein [Chlamydiia bacterium]MCH9615748.1 hypothetical protein [Chlamydiia bacterium]MCH9628849.1 hypothetical protein [Chlamydiia bacterium]
MGKFGKIILGLIVLVIIVLMIIWASLATIVSHKISKQAKVPVSIESLQFTLSSIHMSDFQMDNPSGWVQKTALKIGKTQIDAPITTYFKDKVVIEKLQMNDVYIDLEFDKKGSKKGNWTEIMNNLGSKDTSKNKNSEVLIKRLILTNVNIDLVYKRPDGQVQKLRPISRIELQNVSSKGGVPASEITRIVMQQALRNIFSKENLENMLQDVIDGNDKGGFFKGLFNNAEEHESLLDAPRRN